MFSPIYRAFREAAISHALERVGETAQKIEGRFNVLANGLSHKIMSDSVYSEINIHITWHTRIKSAFNQTCHRNKTLSVPKTQNHRNFGSLFSRCRRHRRPHSSRGERSAVIIDERVDWTIKRCEFIPY